MTYQCLQNLATFSSNAFLVLSSVPLLYTVKLFLILREILFFLQYFCFVIKFLWCHHKGRFAKKMVFLVAKQRTRIKTLARASRRLAQVFIKL